MSPPKPVLSSTSEALVLWLPFKRPAKYCINGYAGHAHCLISLCKEQSISKVAQLIKGESSLWINTNSLISKLFIWQDVYWAVGVSESHLNKVRKLFMDRKVIMGMNNFQRK
ncbi:MAG: transposase [Bacteroidota bacterium]